MNKDTSTIKPRLTCEQGHFHRQARTYQWTRTLPPSSQDLPVNKDTCAIKLGLTSEQGHFHHQARTYQWTSKLPPSSQDLPVNEDTSTIKPPRLTSEQRHLHHQAGTYQWTRTLPPSSQDLPENKDTSTVKPGLTSEPGHFHHQAAGTYQWKRTLPPSSWDLPVNKDTSTIKPGSVNEVIALTEVLHEVLAWRVRCTETQIHFVLHTSTAMSTSTKTQLTHHLHFLMSRSLAEWQKVKEVYSLHLDLWDSFYSNETKQRQRMCTLSIWDSFYSTDTVLATHFLHVVLGAFWLLTATPMNHWK